MSPVTPITNIKRALRSLREMPRLTLPGMQPENAPEQRLGYIDKRQQAFDNGFFDASPLNGWLRCVNSERFEIRYINDYYVKLLGFDSREELLLYCDGSYAKFLHSEEDAAAMAETCRALPEDGGATFTYCLTQRDGGSVWVREYSRRYTDDDGTPMLLCLCIDITDVVRMERDLRAQTEELRIRENEYGLAIANSGKLVYRYTVADRSIDISPEAAALFGHPPHLTNVPESIIETGTVAQNSVKPLVAFYEAIRRGDRTGSMTACRRVRDGSYRWFEARFSTIYNDAGAPVSAIILFEDVTREREEHIVSARDRRSLMVALRTVYPVALSINLTQGRYHAIIGGELIFMKNQEEGLLDDVIRANAARMPEAYAREFTARFLSGALLKSFTEGATRVRMEYRQLSGDGKEHWLETTILRVKNDYDGDMLGIALCRVIDEQKAAEDKLSKALELTSGELTRERQYQSILDASIPIGTVLLRADEKRTLLHVGGTMLGDLGYTEEEYAAFQRNRLRGFVYEPDYGVAFQDQCGGNALPPSFAQEYRVVKKDGSLVWVYEKGTLTSVDGAPAYVLVFVDVTQRKEMEERLRVSEEEINLAMSQIGKMVCVYDVASRTLTMPEKYADKHGFPNVLSGIPYHSDALPPEERAAFDAFYGRVLAGDKTGTVEVRMACADGGTCYERAEFATIFGSDGSPIKAIVSIEDTTQEHLRADETETLRESERVFRMVAAHSNRRIYRYDIATRMIHSDPETAGLESPATAKLHTPEAVIAGGFVLQESVGDFARLFDEIDAGKPVGGAKVHFAKGDGTSCWVDMRYSLIDVEGKKPTAAVLSFQDITEDHERELAYERYSQMVLDEVSSERMVYFETDLSADVVEKQGGNIPGLAFPENGCRHEEAVGYGIERLLPEDARAQAWLFFSREHLITAFADGTRKLSRELPVVMPDGEKCYFHAEVQMIRDTYTGHIRAYTTLHDVTAEMLSALEVKRQAETDGMTGLLNKATTEALVREKLARANGESCLLLIADLDNLKSINDGLGHAQGDRALTLLAGALKAQFRHTDVVGRIGGDEFLAFLPGAGNEGMMRGAMTALMHKLSKLRYGENNDVPLRASIGVAFGTGGKDSFETLYGKADKALYHVKRNGKNDYALYTPDMDETAYEYRGHEVTLVRQSEALERKELDRLLYAVSEIYPLVISVNLTKNSYYMMQYNHYMTKSCFDAGVFDELIAEGAGTFHPDDRAGFLAAFSRENLLAAHARGEKSASFTGRQRGDDGVYRRVCTDVIFAQAEENGDVMEITLAREIDSIAACR